MAKFENAMVYKSNGLIEAGYRLSVAEQRLLLACISQVRRGEAVTDEVMYSVTVDEMAELTEIDRVTTYRDMQEAALRLKRREVRIVTEVDGAKKREQVLICGWVQTIMYIKNEGRVCLRLNKDILPYLNGLSIRFTKYSLKAVAKMDSAYAIRLYEIMIQWVGVGGDTREVEIEWLRHILQIEDKYPAVKDFRVRVIDTAITQINELSDIQASYIPKKTGRRITHLIFSFFLKSEPKLKKQATTRSKKTADFATYVKTHARPGESQQQAELRLRPIFEAEFKAKRRQE